MNTSIRYWELQAAKNLLSLKSITYFIPGKRQWYQEQESNPVISTPPNDNQFYDSDM